LLTKKVTVLNETAVNSTQSNLANNTTEAIETK
jgi:hypothetical protein